MPAQQKAVILKNTRHNTRHTITGKLYNNWFEVSNNDFEKANKALCPFDDCPCDGIAENYNAYEYEGKSYIEV